MSKVTDHLKQAVLFPDFSLLVTVIFCLYLSLFEKVSCISQNLRGWEQDKTNGRGRGRHLENVVWTTHRHTEISWKQKWNEIQTGSRVKNVIELLLFIYASNQWNTAVTLLWALEYGNMNEKVTKAVTHLLLLSNTKISFVSAKAGKEHLNVEVFPSRL